MHVFHYGTFLSIHAAINHWLGEAPRTPCGLDPDVVMGFRAQEMVNFGHCC